MLLHTATAALVVCALACTVSAQNPRMKNVVRDLTFALPSAIVLIVVIIITVVVVYMLYRAKRGYFCCLQPRYRVRRPERSPDLEERAATPTEEGEGPADAVDALPPSYQEGAEQRPLNIAPPDYRDALQDKILSDPDAPPAFDSPAFNQTSSSSPVPSSSSPVPSTEHPLEVTTPPAHASTEATPPPYSESEELPPPPPPISPVDERQTTPTELEDSEDSYNDDRTPLNP